MRATVLPLLLAASLALTACRSETRTPTVVGSAGAGGAARVSLADPLALLPADSDLVVTIDVAALRRSPLFAKYRDRLRDFLVPGFADCQYDPLDDLTTVTAGVPMSATLGVFVLRGLDRQRTLDCLRTSTIETRTAAIFDGEYVTLRNQSGHQNVLTFVDADNAVMQGSEGPTRQTLEQALTVGAPLRANQALVAAQAGLPPGAALSFVTVPGSPGIAERMAARLGAPIHALSMSLHVREDVSGHVVIDLGDPDTAAAFVDDVRPQVDGLRQLVERYDLRAIGPTVVIDLAITEAQLQVFADLVKTFAGGQLGGSAAPGTSP